VIVLLAGSVETTTAASFAPALVEVEAGAEVVVLVVVVVLLVVVEGCDARCLASASVL
jgi:hypothetical protein